MEIALIQDLQKPDLFEKFKIQLSRDFELCGFTDVAPKLVSKPPEIHVPDYLIQV